MAALVARNFQNVRCAVVTLRLTCLGTRFVAFRTTHSASENMKKGLVLGVYEKKKEQGDGVILSAAAKNYTIASKANLKELINAAGPVIKAGKSRIFFNIDKVYSCVALVGLGSEEAGLNAQEDIQEGRENIRIAVAEGARQLRELGCQTIEIDPCNDPEAAAEGSSLGLFCFDELKKEESRKLKVDLQMYGAEANRIEWERGLLKGEGQNLARRLMEMPANLLTPTKFAEIAMETLAVQNVQITPRGRQWIIDHKMGAFLSVAKGSEQAPVFLEMSYTGGKPDQQPVVLVGKGITFDSGGISLKPSKDMDKMRADMGGGACTLAALHTVASLRLPINVIGLVPLCENMPSGGANKPGDVVTAMNGTTIQVDNTDAEGRLILADALCYAHRFNPLVILDMATLTGAMMVALGGAAVGAFSTSTAMWKELQQAGVRTGDRVWRMPLYQYYAKKVKTSHLADLNNITGTPHGGACAAAAFLKEFVTTKNWIHLDIAGVMENTDTEGTCLPKGMSGRPTRTVVEFINRLSSSSSTK